LADREAICRDAHLAHRGRVAADRAELRDPDRLRLLAVRWVGEKYLPLRKIALASFAGYAFSYNFGARCRTSKIAGCIRRKTWSRTSARRFRQVAFETTCARPKLGACQAMAMAHASSAAPWLPRQSSSPSPQTTRNAGEPWRVSSDPAPLLDRRILLPQSASRGIAQQRRGGQFDFASAK